MCQDHHHHITRREFLKWGGAALGGAALAGSGCARRVQVTAIPAINPSVAAPPALAAGEFADAVLVNGNIATMNAKRSFVKALAVKNGVILAVGDDPTIRALAGEQTQVIELGGRTVTPGMIDAHCHLSAAGMLGTVYADLSWPQVFTIEDMQARLAEWIAKTPRGEWVVGSGWVTFGGRYPTRHDLDPVSPNHPVFALNQGGHMAAVNSLALEMAGVTASTKDLGNGRFLHEENGEPSGVVVNHPAMDVFRKLWPKDFLNLQVYENTVLGPQARFASMGVTSFQDVYARDMDRMQAYFNIARRGEMTIRGQVMNVLEYYQELEGRIEEIEAMRYESDFMHFGGGKFQVDGAAEASFTLEPHNGMAWNISIWKPKELNECVQAFHDAGYQVALHTIGDAAVEMALDAIENAMNKNPRPDPRHRIEHAIINSDSAPQRTRDLGVIISTQPQAIYVFADGMERIWGEERVQRMVPTRTWLDLGVPVCLSSDAPSMPWWDPQTTLAASIARISATKKPVGPEQAMTIEEALYAHTMAGAYADFAENKKGSLEPGKFADLAVWHEDPYTATPLDLQKATIDLTMVGGKVVHEVA